MRARVVGFTRTAEWRDEPQYEIRLVVAGQDVNLPVESEVFNRLYRDFIGGTRDSTDTNTFMPPTELHVEITVTAP